MVLTAAFAGLRLGELRGLRWMDVSWGERLHVRESVTAANRRKATKSGGPARCR